MWVKLSLSWISDSQNLYLNNQKRIKLSLSWIGNSFNFGPNKGIPCEFQPIIILAALELVSYHYAGNQQLWNHQPPRNHLGIIGNYREIKEKPPLRQATSMTRKPPPTRKGQNHWGVLDLLRIRR